MFLPISGIKSGGFLPLFDNNSPGTCYRIGTKRNPLFYFKNPEEKMDNPSSQTSSAHSLPILGADLSSLPRSLDLGARYFDEAGAPADPLQLLKDWGVNYVRLRVWVDPANGVNDKSQTIRFAETVKARGMRLLIDFHYSDTWADPEHQVKPAAWAGHDFTRLQKDVYDHTRDVCSSLASAGLAPDMVQIGNEINPGMLLPDGSARDWEKLSALLKRGYEAAKACSSSIQVMLHVANAGDLAGTRAWYDGATSKGVLWDVMGLSYYSYWHGTLAAMRETVADARARYRRPVVIVETAYPFTLSENDGEKNSIHSAEQLSPNFPATPEGQAANLQAVIESARAGGAIGVFYWEPTWTAVKGNGWDPTNPDSGDQWENQALFGFDGRALPAIRKLIS